MYNRGSIWMFRVTQGSPTAAPIDGFSLWVCALVGVFYEFFLVFIFAIDFLSLFFFSFILFFLLLSHPPFHLGVPCGHLLM